MCCFGHPLDRGEPPVPLRGELSHGLRRLVKAVGFYLVENLPALLVTANEPGPLEHDQMLGDCLPGEGHPDCQPAGADPAVADDEIEDPAPRRVTDG